MGGACQRLGSAKLRGSRRRRAESVVDAIRRAWRQPLSLTPREGAVSDLRRAALPEGMCHGGIDQIAIAPDQRAQDDEHQRCP